MSGYLLDTHVWLWLLGASERELRTPDRELIETASKRGELDLSMKLQLPPIACPANFTATRSTACWLQPLASTS